MLIFALYVKTDRKLTVLNKINVLLMYIKNNILTDNIQC